MVVAAPVGFVWLRDDDEAVGVRVSIVVRRGLRRGRLRRDRVVPRRGQRHVSHHGALSHVQVGQGLLMEMALVVCGRRLNERWRQSLILADLGLLSLLLSLSKLVMQQDLGRGSRIRVGIGRLGPRREPVVRAVRPAVHADAVVLLVGDDGDDFSKT